MESTIQQKRAKFALEQIQALPAKLKLNEQVEFIAYANSLPAMIHMHGLGQAMAFCKLKGKERASYGQLYQLVSGWLCSAKQPFEGKEEALIGITQSDMAQYQLAQEEALVLMSWVKKFAKAFLAEEG
jgi:CRISPR-associated protein Cmr5